MATIKSYTDLQQSKVLAEILPLESADMVYLRCDFEDEGEYSILVGSYHEGYAEREDGTIVPVFDEHIPAWSLASLLGVLPEINGVSLKIEKVKAEDGYDGYYYPIEYEGIVLIPYSKNPVDACYEMILKLHELKML